MASTKELQKTLPRHAPNNERHTIDDLDRKFAIYSLVNLETSQLKGIERTLNTSAVVHEEIDDEGTSCAKLANQPDFHGRTLRDVYDHHVRVRDESDWMDPLYFIVLDQEDYTAKGTLAVYLYTYDDEEENRVGVGRCAFDWAVDWGVNFRIGNMSWYELKESEHADWGGDDPYEDDKNGADGE
ncbi:hypothetical protein MBLNU457_1770t1 [Dothideomycetes sp. NU457]